LNGDVYRYIHVFLALEIKSAASSNPPPATAELTVTRELQDASGNPLFNHADNLCRAHSLFLAWPTKQKDRA